MVRGDYEVNDVKLKNLLNADYLDMATPDQVKEYMHAEIGNIGPVNAPEDVQLIADNSLTGLVNLVAGANQAHTHLTNVNPAATSPPPKPRIFASLRKARFHRMAKGC